MSNINRYRIYLIIAVVLFFVSLFRVDFDNLSWNHNESHYIGMLFSAIAFVVIYVFIKKKLEN